MLVILGGIGSSRGDASIICNCSNGADKKLAELVEIVKVVRV